MIGRCAIQQSARTWTGRRVVFDADRRAPIVMLLFVLFVATSCSGGGGGSPSGPSPPPSPGVSVRLSPTSLTLNVGGTGALTATVTDASGAPVPNATVSWQSRNALIASVNNGSVTGISVGQTIVVASSGGQSDSVQVTVL
ncbi:MAG: Ig-like domain-containing protein, partial [Gemmatimonadaceae bacterium]